MHVPVHGPCKEAVPYHCHCEFLLIESLRYWLNVLKGQVWNMQKKCCSLSLSQLVCTYASAWQLEAAQHWVQNNHQLKGAASTTCSLSIQHTRIGNRIIMRITGKVCTCQVGNCPRFQIRSSGAAVAQRLFGDINPHCNIVPSRSTMNNEAPCLLLCWSALAVSSV